MQVKNPIHAKLPSSYAMPSITSWDNSKTSTAKALTVDLPTPNQLAPSKWSAELLDGEGSFSTMTGALVVLFCICSSGGLWYPDVQPSLLVIPVLTNFSPSKSLLPDQAQKWCFTQQRCPDKCLAEGPVWLHPPAPPPPLAISQWHQLPYTNYKAQPTCCLDFKGLCFILFVQIIAMKAMLSLLSDSSMEMVLTKWTQ